MKGLLIMISMTFEKFWAYVSRYISNRIGVGLDDLADVDIWDYYSEHPETKEHWQGAIRDAAEHAMSEQDCVDPEIMALFSTQD
jgi:L-ribulose-5-phosphate 3-epimerase UlaE